jgi:hypothetical protein
MFRTGWFYNQPLYKFRPPTRAVLVCLRQMVSGHTAGTVMTQWSSAAEAMEAESELCEGGCGPGCLSAHMVVCSNGDGGLHVLGGSNDRRLPDRLADRLTLLYPPRDGRPETWPTPEEFNEPLADGHVNSLAERLDRGHEIGLRRQVAPATKPVPKFKCAVCAVGFDPGDTVMFAASHGRGPGRPPTVHPVHPACCPRKWKHGRGETGYERRVCGGCGRGIIVRCGSARAACSNKCRVRGWRSAKVR